MTRDGRDGRDSTEVGVRPLFKMFVEIHVKVAHMPSNMPLRSYPRR